MSIPFFNNVLSAIGRKLNYDSVSNLYGNSFCKDAGTYIQDAYPLAKHKKVNKGMLDMFNRATVIKMETHNADIAKKELSKKLGSDISWAEGLLE